MRLSHCHDPSHEFCGLTRLTHVFLGYFFNWFFFNFILHYLGWLRIMLHNLFRFNFYEVILVSWTESRIDELNYVDLDIFFVFLLIFFFNCILQLKLDWLRIEFYNLFLFVLFWVILISWFSFGRLTCVDSGFFLISFFNIGLIDNLALTWFLISFHKVITVSWPGLQILHVNMGWPGLI
jgi:hypothetical protein